METFYRAIRELAGGEITGIVASVRDVTARKAIEIQLAEANRRLQALAARDPLTGLANRRMLDETLAREYRRAKGRKAAASTTSGCTGHQFMRSLGVDRLLRDKTRPSLPKLGPLSRSASSNYGGIRKIEADAYGR